MAKQILFDVRAREGNRRRDAEVGGVKHEILEHIEAAIRIRPLRYDTDALAHRHGLRRHIRPALAQTAGSVLHCQIPVPAPQNAGSYIAADGSVVPPGTAGAFPPPPRPLTGEEAKALLNHGPTPAGLDPDAAQAYVNYIRRLQAGMSGFTCYASLQLPR